MYFTISMQGVTIISENKYGRNDNSDIDLFCEKEAIIMKKFFEHLEEILEAYYKTFA